MNKTPLTLGLLGDDVADVVLGAGAKDGSQALSTLLTLGAQVGIAIITGLLAVSDEVNSLSGSQRGSGKEKKSGLHLGMFEESCKATAEEEVICETLRMGMRIVFMNQALITHATTSVLYTVPRFYP